jgi:hypothetical protein
MKTQNQKTELWQVIIEKHTENCARSEIGYEMERLESQIIDNAIEKIHRPTLAEIATQFPLEDMRNSDKETADQLLKRAVENWIGAKCLNALTSNRKFSVSQNYIETCTVCITLADNWTDWLN